MKVTPKHHPLLRKHLRDGKLPVRAFHVKHPELLERLKDECKRQQPDSTEAQIQARSLFRYSALYVDHSVSKRWWFWALVLAALMLLGYAAHGQTNPNINVDRVGKAPVTLGQKAMAGSIPVTIASDQSNLPTDPQGPDAQGAAQTGKPLQNAGRNYSDGKIYTIAVDANGIQQFAVTGLAVACAGMPGLTGDVTSSGSSCATTVSKIQSNTVTGTTGTGNVVFDSAATILPKKVGAMRYADQYAGADCGAKINAADADLTVKGGVILVNANCGRTWTTAITLHNDLRFIEMGTWTFNQTITFSSGGITIEGLGFYDVNTNAVGTKLLWNGSSAVDCVVAKGTVGNRLDRLGMSNLILDGAGATGCRYTFNIQKADEYEFHNVRIHAGSTAGFLCADATGGKFFNVSIANVPVYGLILSWGCGGFDWVGGEVAPQQGETQPSIVIEGATNGVNIQGVEIDNGNTPFAGFGAINGYDTNSSFADVPSGHPGAPNNVNFYNDRWIYTGGTAPTQGADWLVSGTATNPSSNILFFANLFPGLNVGAVAVKFDFTQDDFIIASQFSGHTTGLAATLQTTNNTSRPTMEWVISSDSNRTAAGSGNILDVRSVPAGVMDIGGIAVVVPRGASCGVSASGQLCYDSTANLFIGGVNAVSQKFLMHNLANTLGASGTIDASAASGTIGFKTPVAAGAAPTANGALSYDSTANKYVGGINGTKNNFVSDNIANTAAASMTLDMSLASGTVGLKLPIAAGAAPTVNGAVAYDSTANQYSVGVNGTNRKVPIIVATGTSAMTTAGIATGACGTTVTTTATGAATTDVIDVARNAAPTNGNGGNLILNWWPTSGNVNFNYCNPSAGTVTPTAMTVNWVVRR